MKDNYGNNFPHDLYPILQDTDTWCYILQPK